MIVGLGFASTMAFIAGLTIYFLGLIVSCQIKDLEKLEHAGIFSIILLLCNLAFFSSREIIPLVDASFAFYVVVLVDLAVLVLRKSRLQQTNLNIPYKWSVGFFLITIVLSALSAETIKDVIYYFVVYLFALVLFYVALNLISNKSSVVTIIKAIFGISLASSLIAIWQLYSATFKSFYYPFIASRDQEILELWEVVSRVVGTWQHPSYLGIIIAASIPIGLYLLLYETKNRSWKVIIAFMVIVISAVLLLTNTRSSVISAVIGVVVLFWFSRNARGRALPTMREFAIIGTVAACSLLLYQFVFVAEIYTKPQAWRVDASATIWGRFLRSDRMSTESLVQRSQLYSLAWQEFTDHPVVGIGGKNFPYVVEGIFERGTDAHNIFLQTLAETGIIGFLALLLLYGKLLKDVLSKTGKEADQALKAVLAAVLIVILFDSLFNNPLYSLRILAVFWLIAGLLIVKQNLFVSSSETSFKKSLPAGI